MVLGQVVQTDGHQRLAVVPFRWEILLRLIYHDLNDCGDIRLAVRQLQAALTNVMSGEEYAL